MKPIIEDIQDITDSVEVYNSRPNPFFIYFIYLLAALLAAAFLWMSFAKIDIVIKSSGILKSDTESYEISSGASGQVALCNINEGQYVQEGDILFTVQANTLNETITHYEGLLADVEKRIEILHAYEESLEGSDASLLALQNNPYYTEFINRKNLLEAGFSADDNSNLVRQSQEELNNLDSLIAQYESQISKLNQVKECFRTRTNCFDAGDSYYASMVNSYISNWQVTALQYDNQISSCQSQIESLNRQMESLSGDSALEKPETIMSEETDSPLAVADFPASDAPQTAVGSAVSNTETIDSLSRQIFDLNIKITSITSEKEQALSNLELQQTAAVEQQIESVQNTLLTVRSNRSSVQSQLDALLSETQKDSTQIDILTEKASIDSELLTYENKKIEYENTLKQYDLESGNTVITAPADGYISLNQELRQGTYLQSGTAVCRLLPDCAETFYADVYVENSDIAKLKEGQQVKFEIAAYPSSEYGYFTGTVQTIAKDIKVDQNSGSAYYLVKVSCDTTTVTNRDGKTGTILNGMACQAKIVVDQQNVLYYLLEKIDLLD